MNEAAHWLEVAQHTAIAAGALLRSRWQEAHTLHFKGPRNVVTEADLASEQLITERLHAAFPHHTIIGEEQGRMPGSDTVHWLIDPLDGTTNFSRHHPTFCLSIAAVVAGQPIVGVIHDPLRGHTFAAQRGCGATLNGAPLHTAETTTLEQAICAVDWPRDNARRQQLGQLCIRLLGEIRTLRALGSAALGMAYVAAGWLDLYFALQLSPWDQAASGLLVQEAGGATRTFSGDPWTPQASAPIMSATPALLEAFQARLAEEN